MNHQAVGVIADVSGPELGPSDHELLQHDALVGVILFARHYQSPQQLLALTDSIRSVRPELLICIDQEGGRVQRCRQGFTRLPAMLSFEAPWQQDAEATLVLVKDAGWLMATELIACGVDLSFAPVLDIEYGCSQVIGDRAFGHSCESVVALAGAWIDGMQQAGMAATAKHFPGHGAVVADSHVELPVDSRDIAQLQRDMTPFAELINAHKLAAVMPAHVTYSAVDPDFSAGFSRQWLQRILRAQLGFDGIIFSDDLSMQGAAEAGDYASRSKLAVQAGAQALLACNNRDGALQVLHAVQSLALPRLDLQPLQATLLRRQQAQADCDSERAQHTRARLQPLTA